MNSYNGRLLAGPPIVYLHRWLGFITSLAWPSNNASVAKQQTIFLNWFNVYSWSLIVFLVTPMFGIFVLPNMAVTRKGVTWGGLTAIRV